MRIFPKLAGTLSLIIVQFLITYGTWILAQRLQLSPIVAVVALAAVIARYMPVAHQRSRSRQLVRRVGDGGFRTQRARVLIDGPAGARHFESTAERCAHACLGICRHRARDRDRRAFSLRHDATVSCCARFARFFEPRLHSKVPTASIGVLVSWCGMRGLVTLATALALPQEFPSRDVIVLSAFIVVLGTLILQGFTIRPLIALLRIAPDASLDEEVSQTRNAMLDAALKELAEIPGEGAAALRAEYGAARAGNVGSSAAGYRIRQHAKAGDCRRAAAAGGLAAARAHSGRRLSSAGG